MFAFTTVSKELYALEGMPAKKMCDGNPEKGSNARAIPALTIGRPGLMAISCHGFYGMLHKKAAPPT
jgi:hypothetical protein